MKEISVLAAAEYLEQRAARGGRRKFERALRKVKDVEPEERDRLAKCEQGKRGQNRARVGRQVGEFVPRAGGVQEPAGLGIDTLPHLTAPSGHKLLIRESRPEPP